MAFIQDAGTITMQVGSLVPGATYEARMYIAARPNVTGDGLFGGDRLDVLYDGRSIGTFTPAGTAFEMVTTARFKAVAGRDTIVLTSPSSGRDQSNAIDGVRIVRVG